MSVTHYQSNSRGPVEIATMEHRHLVNAHRKLADDRDPERAAEVQAMADQIAANEARFAAEDAAKAQEGAA